MKKVIICFLLMIILFGCQKPQENVNNCNHDLTQDDKDIIKDRPLYITSLGQAIDIENLIIRLEHYKVTNYRRENILKPEDIVDNAVIIIIAGCSTKGLGDAGTNVNEEIERARVLYNLKEEKKLLIVVFHIGGNDRRGTTSDTLISEAFRISDIAIFLESGNQDNYLCDIATEYDIPHKQYATIGQMDESLIWLFNIQN